MVKVAQSTGMAITSKVASTIPIPTPTTPITQCE